jgi:hypothetical protein
VLGFAKTAGVAEKAIGAAGKLANIAGQTAGKFTGKIASGALAKKAIEKTTEAAIESALFQVGSNISEAALGDTTITAQKLLANTGNAAMLGGGLSLGLTAAGGVAGKLASGLKKSIAKAGDLIAGNGAYKSEIDQIADNAVDAMSKNRPTIIDDDVWTNALATKRKEVVDSLSDFLTPEGAAKRQELIKQFGDIGQREKNQAAIYDTLTELTDNNKAAVNFLEEYRDKMIDATNKDFHPGLAKSKAVELLGEVNGMISKVDDKTFTFDQYYVNKANSLAKELAAVVDDGKLGAPGVFRKLNNIKKEIQDIAYPKSRSLSMMSPSEREGVLAFRDFSSKAKNALEDESVFGEMGAIQSTINRAESALIAAKKDGGFLKFFGDKTGAIDGGKINQYLNQAGAAKGVQRDTSLIDFQDATKGLYDTIVKLTKPEQRSFDVDGFYSLLNKNKSAIDEARITQSYESKVRARDMFGMSMLNAVNTLTGGIPVVNKLGTSLDNVIRKYDYAKNSPIKAVEMMSHIEGRAMMFDKAVTKAASMFNSAATSGFAGRSASIAGYESAKAALSSSAEERALAMSNNTDAVTEYAPSIQSAIVTRKAIIDDFLISKLPKTDSTTGIGNFEKHEPSDIEKATWLRYYEAANDPMSVVKNISSGVVTREEIETIKNVYPAVYEQIKSAYVAAMAESKSQPNYQRQTAIAMLFDLPTHKTLEKGFIALMQKNAAIMEQENKASQGAMSAPSSAYSTSLMTDTQRTATRRIRS